jgi:hypothetical protein
MEYINKKNQQILWSSANKMQCFHSIMDENYKKELFKYVIEIFYENNKNRQLAQSELIELNKKTILHVIKLLNKEDIPRVENKPNHSCDVDLQEEELPIIFDNSYKKQPKQIAYSQEFLNRQKDYEFMMKKDVPKNGSLFENKIEDKAIENMEELLQQQIKQRELEIQPINQEIKMEIEQDPKNTEVLKKKVSFQLQ